MRYFIIGDIHGCYAELRDLLDKAALNSDDQIISIGDMVDRGLDSASVIEFFRDTPNADSIMGNHERKHVRWFDDQVEPAASQIITRKQITEDNYPEVIGYMSDLPHYMDLPDALLVHGFYEPGVPLEDQRETVIVGTLSGEDYLRKRWSWPWYERYDGDKPLIMGHRDYTDKMQVLNYKDRVWGIDTRCVYGGSLTGLMLPGFDIISVPSRGDHWADLQRQYADVIRGYDAK
jgi:serine/threonine protein phosphatase 1